MNTESEEDIEDMEDIGQKADIRQRVGEKRCNCDDEFKTETCPIHFKISDKFNNDVVIVTDDSLVPEEIRQWSGYAYECPKCGQASILDIMKYCGNCGVGVVLKSAKLTSFINKLTERNNGR